MGAIVHNPATIQRILPRLKHRINLRNTILPNNSTAINHPIQNNQQIINSHNRLNLLIIKLPNQMPQELPIMVLGRVVVQ